MSYRKSSPDRTLWPYVVGAVVAALVVGGFFVVRDVIAFGRPLPVFPSLADAPDPSISGTVAYIVVVADPKTQPTGGCVRVTAAAGFPSRDVLCFEAGADDTGPQLAFLPDGLLEVTMFSWPTDRPLVSAWQTIVDVRTGDTYETPPDELPAAPSALVPGVSVSGERIEATVRSNTAELRIIDVEGASRTVWTADVSPEYGMETLWAPGGNWALAFDGRLLRVTIGESADIRVLAEEPTGWGGFGSTDPPITIFAVTGQDVLTPDA